MNHLRKLGAVALTVGLVACSGGDSQEAVDAWCEKVAEIPDSLAEARAVEASGTFGDLEEQLDRMNALLDELASTAPGSIEDDVRTVIDTDSDTLVISEQDAVAESRDAVNEYIRDECDLNIGL